MCDGERENLTTRRSERHQRHTNVAGYILISETLGGCHFNVNTIERTHFNRVCEPDLLKLLFSLFCLQFLFCFVFVCLQLMKCVEILFVILGDVNELQFSCWMQWMIEFR